ncbi:MAG TPA: hypothetical protein VIK89_04020 [Cytophagaceae bacterium]
MIKLYNKLGEVCDFPYAGVWYVVKKDTWFDLSGYDYFKIRSGSQVR